MGIRGKIKEKLLALREKKRAAPGVRVWSFVEAEAALEAARAHNMPVFFMVPVWRPNLKAFTEALKGLEGEAYVQLVGSKVKDVVEAAKKLRPDAVYFMGGEVDEIREVCESLSTEDMVVEAILPWQEVAPGQGSEGRIVDLDRAEPLMALRELDIAAVPVGGGPGPYKSWRVPLWSVDAFARCVEIRQKDLLSLPWGSLLPKDLLTKFNRYGGALPGVVSLPTGQYRPFLNLGAAKIALRTDCHLAFLGALRESLFVRPERSEVDLHLQNACEGLKKFLTERFADFSL